MKLLDALITAFYPHKCYACNRTLKSGVLCPVCRKTLLFINPKKRCRKCGLERDNCQCGRYVYHFEAVASVFEYSNAARDIVNRYKFSHEMFLSRFFVEYMANAIKEEFSDVDFDLICYVPTSLKNVLSRGYDQSKLLCKGISKRLLIPMKKTLRCKVFCASQHNSAYEQRFVNVRNKYKPVCRLSGKRVLLVDDIKTTGATLDECARQLLLAGAHSVYCVTALASVYKKDKNTVDKNNKF